MNWYCMKSKYFKVLTWKLSNMYIMCSILCQRHRKHFVSFCLFTIFYAKVYAHNLHIFTRFMIYLAQSEKSYLISVNIFSASIFLAWFLLVCNKWALSYFDFIYNISGPVWEGYLISANNFFCKSFFWRDFNMSVTKCELAYLFKFHDISGQVWEGILHFCELSLKQVSFWLGFFCVH